VNEIETRPTSPLREIIQPFVDLVHAPRALWALNLSYLVEGFVYFGTLMYLAMYFNQYAALGDKPAGYMVGVLTSGITFAMLFFGSRTDHWGLRPTLLVCLLLMLAGRILLALLPRLGLAGGHLGSPFALMAIVALLFIVAGFGMYQPAIYAGVRQITTPATSSMAFAMLYALNNLGGWLPSFMAPLRERAGIQGAMGFYAIASLAGMVLLFLLLNKRTFLQAVTAAKTLAEPAAETPAAAPAAEGSAAPERGRLVNWLRNHPLANPKFSAFIFCLIPVQTLFAYTWFILPQYVSRAFAGSWVGERFEAATQLSSLLVFILCPIVAALSSRLKVYSMMVLGTAVMALPPFFLTFGPTVTGLFAYVVVLSIGEAMWQPRFLQFAAEIAPEGRTGAYMGVAQFPWFLTKMLVPLYSGAALTRWCPMPGQGEPHTGTMWLVFGAIAIVSPLFLIISRGWLGKDFKTRA
jgi:MFS family permease